MHNITLQLEPTDQAAENQRQEHTFSERASIGRGSDMDFVLLDTESIVSKHHCDIYLENDNIMIVDYSSNGTLLNGSPLSHSVPSQMNNGDKLIIGDFTVAVAINEREAKPAESAEAEPESIPESIAPVVVAEPASDQPAEAEQDQEGNREAAASPEPVAESTEENPSQPVQEEPRAAPQETIEKNTGRDTKPIQKPPREEDPYEAFVRAAGISEKALDGMDPVKTMELAGQIIRTTVYGIRQTMLYRTKVKKYLESNITTLLPQDNNPLKFTVSEDHAINTIFSDQIKGFLPPDEAFRDVFNDIIQVMASTVEDSSTKNEKLVEVLNPANYEQRIKEHPHGNIPYYKYKVMWRLFSEDFESLNKDAKSWQV